MNWTFENGHVDGTEQTAAHFRKVITTKDATIAELQEKLDALEEERLDLLGKRDRSEWSYKTLKVELKAEYKTMVEAVEREAAGRIEAMEADRDLALADLEKEREKHTYNLKCMQRIYGLPQFEQDSVADPWKAWIEREYGIPDDPRQCPTCEVTYSTIIRPERLLCGACYPTEYPRFQAVLEDVDRELEAAGREHEEAEVESEDEAPETPAKRQCL